VPIRLHWGRSLRSCSNNVRGDSGLRLHRALGCRDSVHRCPPQHHFHFLPERRTQIVLPDVGNIALITYELHDWRDAQSFPNRRRTHSDWAVSTM
jgi:hypothetical protein